MFITGEKFTKLKISFIAFKLLLFTNKFYH